ncbi:MAG TPA: pseudouridine synthase [Microbacteriaceae bacterium]|nr:pseudouridine synthase [Microbacteriaceae bacterium]
MGDASEEGERLQKVLAAAGVASRRVVEQYIAEGRVTVDGRVAELGQRVTLDSRVEVDGTPVQLDTGKRYVILNKPTGVVSSMADDRGRRDLTEFTRDYPERLYNVGRLDFDTSGLLLLTNDGELAHVLAHPSFGVEKTYVAKVRGKVQHAAITRLKAGIELDDGPIAADAARVMGVSGDTSLVELTIHSGRNRIVRRMLDEVGHPVLELVRRQFGPLRLGSLGAGRSRDATPVELGALLKLVRKAEQRAAHEAGENGSE